MLATEIQHLLRLRDPADQRARQRLAPDHQGAGVQRRLLAAQKAHQHQGAARGQGGRVGIEIVRIRHGVEDQLELAAHRLHLRLVGADDHPVRAQAPGVGLLAGGTAEQRDLGPQGLGQLQGHVPQPAQADHSHLAARTHFPVAQGRPGGDAGTQQRRRTGQVQPAGHLQHEFLAHHDLFRIAALGGAAIHAVDAVVGVGGTALAVLLPALGAGAARLAAVHHAAHADHITGLDTLHGAAHGAHAADDLVPRHRGIDRAPPVVARRVQVRVADAAVEDVDHHIFGTRVAPHKMEQPERAGGRLCGIAAGGLAHGMLLCRGKKWPTCFHWPGR